MDTLNSKIQEKAFTCCFLVFSIVVACSLQANASSILTQYEGLKELFLHAEPPRSSQFMKEELWVGQCVSEGEAQTFNDDVLNTYLVNTPVLGKSIYVIPLVVGLTEAERKSVQLNPIAEYAQAARIHRKGMKQINHFSSLQFEYPEEMPFSAMERQVKVKAAYVFFSKTINSKAGHLPIQLYFRVRMARLEGEGVMVIQYFCPYQSGCQFKNSLEHYRHMQPYAYCYYEKRFSFFAEERSSPSGLVSEPIRIEEDIDLLEPE